MIICIDFDGTIVEHAYPEIGKLKVYAREVINLLHKNHYIIIWTNRCDGDLKKMRKYLDEVGIKYDTINENVENSFGFRPYPKVYADVFIDDRNIGGIPCWLDIHDMINKMEEVHCNEKECGGL